jgi:predicted dithiol-disulfide oxidoreductase (DUF899 family)
VITHPVVSKSEWLKARTALLAKEKTFTRERDALSSERRALPWVRIDKDYVFEGRNGELTLADLFGGKSQLIVWHFMFGPGWQAGCKSCSFWADQYNAIPAHLAQRDVSLVAVSRAPLRQLEAFKRRMGWSFEWVSSYGSSFNHDFAVSFGADQIARNDNNNYNFGTSHFGGEEAPGLSVFVKDADGGIYHTYSCYARGLDMLNGAYHQLDLVPKGRDEEALSYPMEWVRLHDEYEK